MPTSRDILNETAYGGVPIGSHTQTAAISAATAIAVPKGARYILIQCATQNVRITFDGTTTPTATVGFLIVAAAAPQKYYVQGCTIQVIEVGATAKLDYQFFA